MPGIFGENIATCCLYYLFYILACRVLSIYASTKNRGSMIPNKQLRQLLRPFPYLIVKPTKRHIKILHPNTGNYLIAPSTGSDWRSIKNLRSDLRKLLNGGGYLLDRYMQAS